MNTQLFASKESLNTHATRRDVHPYVLKHLSPFSVMEKSVFIPLGGASLDLLYFSQYAERVVGVEIEEKAIQEFFEENHLSYEKIGERYVSGNVTIFSKDLFDLTPGEVGEIDIVYDRAALVALPLPMRLEYLQKIEKLTTPGTVYFLNTIEYTASLNNLPFNIDVIRPEEVCHYFPNYAIEHVENPALARQLAPRFNQKHLIEHCFLMRKLYDASYASLVKANQDSIYEFS